MWALLKLVPLKDWFYSVLFTAVLAGLVWVYHHGELHVEKVDTKIAAVAAQQVQTAQATAQTTETESVQIYKQAVATPTVGDIGVECVRRAPSVRPLPAPNASAGTPVDKPTADSGSGPSFDPSGAALTRAAEADAQIAYLQRRVKELEAEMNKAP